MKTVDVLLSELRRREVKLWVEGDRLRYRAPEGAMTPALLDQLRTQKAEILTFLNQVNEGVSAQRPPLVSVDRTGTLLLSFAQQRLWLLQQFEPDTPANNMPVVVRFTGSLNIPALKQSLQEIVHRHEILRTTFPIVDGQPVLAIAAELPISLPIVDMQAVPEEQREAEIHQRASLAAKQPFDLVNGSVVWFKLFQLAEQEHLLLWNMHAIVCDGTSADLFYRELTTLYAAFSSGQPSPLPKLPVQYPDFAQWQRQWLQGEVLQSYLNYWKQKLSGQLPPPLQLPIDHLRPVGVQTYQGDRYARMLPRQLHHDLMRLSQQMGTTLFVTLLTTFNILLHRYSQQTELLTTFVSSGRSQVETEALMGFFSNTLVLRTAFQSNASFREMLQQVHQSVLEAHTYQDLPFEKLVEELRPEQNQSRSPLYQVKFTLNPPWTNGRGMATVDLPDLTIKALFGYIYNGKTKFDLTLVMREQDEGLGTVFDFNADLFDTCTVARMMDHLQTLLESIVVSPDQQIAELPLMTAAEQQQLRTWSVAPRTLATCLHHRFEAQVEQSPDAIALVFEDQTLTYEDLNQRANQLAHYLQQLGVQTETPVGLCLERSPDLIVALLGILKAGGACVLLNPAASSDSLSWIVEDVQMGTILTQSPFAIKLPSYSIKLVCLDKDWQAIIQQPTDSPDSSVTAEHLAMVVYPPNATGKRTIHLSHRAIERCAEVPDTTPAIRVCLHWTDPAHPVANFEIWGSLLHGAKLVLLPYSTSLADLALTVQRHQITTLWLPTRMFHQLVAEHLESLTSVRQLFTDSAPLCVNPVQAFLQGTPDRTLIQTFNLPEHPAWICAQTITTSTLLQDGVSCGQLTATTPIHILDHHLQPVPIGIPGELYISGDGLARSAANPSGWTENSFTDNSFIASPSQVGTDTRRYKTDYSVRWLPKGELELLGQAEDWVKIQDLPIRLRQVEAAIAKHPAIQEVHVLAAPTDVTEPSLVAYLVPQWGQTAIVTELRNFLKQKLPGHLIPSVFICLDRLPLTATGAIDHSALPAPEQANQSEEAAIAFQDETERQLTEIWQQLLGIPTIRQSDNFFDLGGDSLLAIRLFAQIEKTFHKNLPLATLLQAPTIEQFAQVLRQDTDTINWSPLVLIQEGGAKPPLFCVHGGGFNVLIYRDLATNLPPDQPVYGLQARGLAGDNEPLRNRIEAIATDYVKQIQTLQPKGPYFLSGLSNGGNIALEMAQQIRAQGQEVALLALFDSYTSDSARLLSPFPRLLSSLSYALRYSSLRFIAKLPRFNSKSISTELRRLRKGRSMSQQPEPAMETHKSSQQPTGAASLDRWMNHISQYILDHSPWSFFTPTAQLSQLQDAQSSMSETLKKLEQVYSKAHKEYTPSVYTSQIVLFRAKESPPGFHLDPDLGWKKLAAGGLEVHRVPGHHTQIMKSSILAEKLSTYLEKAQASHQMNIKPIAAVEL